MQIGNRFGCSPNPEQANILLQWIGCQRYIYNAKIREDQYFRRFSKKSLWHTGVQAPIDQKYSQFKTQLSPWLFEVPSPILGNGAVLWKQAYHWYFSKLGGRPTIQRKQGKQSVWLTSELFGFKPVGNTPTGKITEYQLHIGTKKFPVGRLAFKAHRDYQIPISLHISIHAGQWYLWFPEPTDKETRAWLTQFDQAELRKMTVGLDRGVALPLASSDGQPFDFSERQQKRLIDQEKYKKRWQRRQARRMKGSTRWITAKHKVARYCTCSKHSKSTI